MFCFLSQSCPYKIINYDIDKSKTINNNDTNGYQQTTIGLQLTINHCHLSDNSTIKLSCIGLKSADHEDKNPRKRLIRTWLGWRYSNSIRNQNQFKLSVLMVITINLITSSSSI